MQLSICSKKEFIPEYYKHDAKIVNDILHFSQCKVKNILYDIIFEHMSEIAFTSKNHEFDVILKDIDNVIKTDIFNEYIFIRKINKCFKDTNRYWSHQKYGEILQCFIGFVRSLVMTGFSNGDIASRFCLILRSSANFNTALIIEKYLWPVYLELLIDQFYKIDQLTTKEKISSLFSARS
jgi:hypothetical protein